MTDEAAVLQETNKERNELKKSAQHKKNGCARSKLGNKPISWQEARKKNGQEQNYELNSFMTFDVFCKMPDDLVAEYINKLQNEYLISIRDIGYHLFGMKRDNLSAWLNQKNLLVKCRSSLRTDKAGLDRFVNDIRESRKQSKIAMAMSDPKDYATFKTRKKSLLIKALIKACDGNLNKIYKSLDITKTYYNTKLARDSFSFEDLIIIANSVGLHFGLLDSDGKLQHSIIFEDWFHDYDESVIERIHKIDAEIAKAAADAKRKEAEAKHKEYEQLKLNLQRMKEEYGFSD